MEIKVVIMIMTMRMPAITIIIMIQIKIIFVKNTENGNYKNYDNDINNKELNIKDNDIGNQTNTPFFAKSS